MKTLVLSADMRPTREIPVTEALVKVFQGKAYSIEEYAGVLFRSVRMSLPAPRVIVAKRYVKLPAHFFGAATLTNEALFLRDAHTCQYCGRPKERLKRDEKLTRDHVTPQCQGGLDTWENCVTACSTCNGRKADKRPTEAGMTLRAEPSVFTRDGLHEAKLTRSRRRPESPVTA